MTTAQTSSGSGSPPVSVSAEEQAAIERAKQTLAGFPNHFFWDTGGDFRATFYQDEVLPNLSPAVEKIRASREMNVTRLIKDSYPLPRTTLSGVALVRSSRPAFRSPTLIRKSGYYVVLRNEHFNYFRCLAEPSGEHLLKMTKAPPIFSEGVYILNKEVFFVTEKDLRKGIIRRSRKLTLKRLAITYADILNDTLLPGGGTPATSDAADPRALSDALAAPPGTIEDPDDLGSLSASELAERQAIDLAFNEQIRELLGASSQEEVQWETSEDTQSE